MMVGGIDKQIYLEYQLAESLGMFKKYGVDMQLSTEQAGGVGAEDAMISGQVDMAGAWYVHTIDFQQKGKDVINIVQLAVAPGERIMCATGTDDQIAGRLERPGRWRDRHRLGHRRPRELRLGSRWAWPQGLQQDRGRARARR